MPTKKYGNDRYWCFIEDGWNGKEVAVWCGPSENERVIARANDKYDAKKIVDALLHCQPIRLSFAVSTPPLMKTSSPIRMLPASQE